MTSLPIEYIESFEPVGVWKPPLTSEQIRAAITFGAIFYSSTQEMIQEHSRDPYGLWLNEPNLTITLATTFGRLAAYSGQCSRTGINPHPSEVENINFSSSLQHSFMMRVISKHKIVSVLHRRTGKWQNMNDLKKVKNGQLFTETFTFPYPEELAAPQEFEVCIPSFMFFTKKENVLTFDFDFGTIH